MSGSLESPPEQVGKVLITGALGFLGSHVTELMLEQGWHVVGVDNFDQMIRSPRERRDFLCSIDQPNWSFHEGSVSDYLSNIDQLDFDRVIHIAGSVGLKPSWDFPKFYYENNCGETAALVAAVRTSTRVQRVVHISTSSVYGSMAVGNEDEALNPISPYGRTKLGAEQLWTSHPDLAHRTVILRMFSLFGPRQRPDMVWSKFIDAGLRHKPIVVSGDGNQSRSFTYVQDAARAVASAVNRKEKKGIFNIAGRDTYSINDGIQILSEIFQCSFEVEYRDTPMGDQYRTEGDYSRAAKYLDFKHSVTFEEGLYAQYRYQKSWCDS